MRHVKWRKLGGRSRRHKGKGEEVKWKMEGREEWKEGVRKEKLNRDKGKVDI